MSKFSRSRLLMLAAATLGVAMLAPTVSADHSWGNYHWARQSNPFTLKLADNLTATWDPFLVTTSNDWSSSAVLDTTIVAGTVSPKTCKPLTGQVDVCNAKYGFNGWLGVAQIWASGSHITKGAVKLNDSYFNTAKYNTAPWRNLVMCQEVGHTFGLDHQDENFSNTPLGTCMDYSNDPVPNQHPNTHDYQQLETIYNHLDSTTTVASAPAAMNDIVPEGPGQWGRLVSSSRGGKHEVYELDFGGGHKIITFVTWADGPRGEGRDDH
jgi:hypothetical protein